MTDLLVSQDNRFAISDPTTVAYWDGARTGRLMIQHCAGCDSHQFYPRPFCLSCSSRDLEWVVAAGAGSIYSMTTIHIPVIKELAPPYILALVQLDEGPRLLTNIEGDGCAIGDRVEVRWLVRDGLPLPLFTAITTTDR